MTRKKVSNLALAIVLALTMVAGVWQSGWAAANITSNSYFLGNQGIYIPGGLDPETVWLTRVTPLELAGAPVKFTHPAIELHFKGADGKDNHFPYVLTYVIFNLNNKERMLWENGDLHIYYRDVIGKTWKVCTSETFFPNISAPEGRLACLAPQYTTFGIAITPKSE